MARFVLSDAAPLICLSQVEGLAWLSSIFGQVHITREVHDEILGGRGKPGEEALDRAVKKGVLHPLPGRNAGARVETNRIGELLVRSFPLGIPLDSIAKRAANSHRLLRLRCVPRRSSFPATCLVLADGAAPGACRRADG